MEIKFKKLSNKAHIPTKAHQIDAGFDLYAANYEYDATHDCNIYYTDIAMEIPQGYVGLLFPRSSNRKTDAYMTNHVGVIDSGYRGNIALSFKNRDEELIPTAPYDINDRVGQIIIMPYPEITFVESDELSESDRGENGHGSSGK